MKTFFVIWPENMTHVGRETPRRPPCDGYPDEDLLDCSRATKGRARFQPTALLGSHSGFTLIEMLVSVAVGMTMLAIVTSMLLSAFKTWQSGLASMDLSIQSRILRERMLHGIQGQFGLRYADRGTLVYTTNNLQFTDFETSEVFTIALQTNSPLSIQNGSGSNVFSTHRDVVLQSSAVTQSGNVLTVNMTFSTSDGKRVLSQAQQIRTYLLND